MDEFAQTRGDDDLFNDEIIPVATEEQAESKDEVKETELKHDDVPPTQDVPTQQPHSVEASSAKKRGAPLWHRGKRGTPYGKSTGGTDDHHGQDVSTAGQAGEANDATGSKASHGAPNKHFPAVRGDRSATGGVRKPKLTGEELEKKIAAARENAAKVAAAHARAEADQASFLEREKVAAEKRREEDANRRAMDSERAKNRERKLNAATGREWDSSKHEDEFSSRGRGQYRRGMYGAVSGRVRRDFDQAPSHNKDRPRRGHGSGRRGVSHNRADHNHQRASNEPESGPSAPAVTSETEFPSLDNGKKDHSPEQKSTSATEQTEAKSPVGGSWADQVEESN